MSNHNLADFRLQEYLEAHQKRCQDNLRTALNLNYRNSRLGEAMQYACLNGGKRLRPVLVHAAAEAVNADSRIADGPATAVELIHCYSLAHDDLPAMDDDDLRRGKPTVHKAYDEATAILVGDALQSLAFDLLGTATRDLPAAVVLTMIQSLARASGAMGMVGGQALDFAAVGQQLNLEQLQTMHNLKTGALISCSVELGALCNPQVTKSQLEALKSYAANIGLAFQIQDDILDETGDTQTLGKPQGSDKASHKPTFVSLLGIDAARKQASDLCSSAISALSGFESEANPLRALALYMVNRTF